MPARLLPLMLTLILTACHSSKSETEVMLAHQSQQNIATAARFWSISDTLLFMPITMPLDVYKDNTGKHIALPDQEAVPAQRGQQPSLPSFPYGMIVRHTQANEQISDTTTSEMKSQFSADHEESIEREPFPAHILSLYILSAILIVLLLTARSKR